MKRISIFSYDIYEQKDVGILKLIPELRSLLLQIETYVRENMQPYTHAQSAHILDEGNLQPIRNYFVAEVARCADVSVDNIRCIRSWCIVSRPEEHVFFDRNQWWGSQQSSMVTGLHNHLPFHFTGVYYVDVECEPRQSIFFLNPVPSSFGRIDWYEHQPKNDSFLIFESHLWHRIPWIESSDTCRIAVSMDAIIVDVG